MSTNEFITYDGKFHIESHGNGWSYSITCQTTGANLWFQDDDTSSLQLESEDFTNTDIVQSYFDCLCE